MEKHVSVSLGQYLKSLRKQKKMTQVEISRRSGLSKSYVSFLESDLRHPSREVVLKIAKILLLPTSDQDTLLIKAGYAPLQSQTNKSITKSEPKDFPEHFPTFMQRVLESIRQGDDALAQEAIEIGFQRYARPAEMQTLLAHLELSKENFAHAILSQQTALKHAEISGTDTLAYLDYGLNLGVMYFLWGDNCLFKSKNPEQAIQYYQKALACYEDGLCIAPKHLYLLDESARVHFNLADLMVRDSKQASYHWQCAKQAFRAVLAHPDNSQINPQERITSVVFFALACAKLNDHHEASLILDTLQTLQKNDWLVDYIYACVLCLRYTANHDTPRDLYLARAKTLLIRAIQKNPDALEQARLDQKKDLHPLQSDPEISLLFKETSNA